MHSGLHIKSNMSSGSYVYSIAMLFARTNTSPSPPPYSL